MMTYFYLQLPSAFDPKPFIRSFEAAVDKLIAVRRDVQTKTEQMEKNVRVSEREYSKKMAELNKGFEVCFSRAKDNILSIQDCWQFFLGYGE